MLRLLIILGLLFCSCNIFTSDTKNSNTLIVFNFDDGHESIYKNSFSIMESFDTSWTATNFISVNAIDKSKHLTLEMLKELETHGWSTGGHGVSHENLSSVSLVDAEKEIRGSYEYLKEQNLSFDSFAYPSGNYNDGVQKITEKYFKNIRSGSDLQYSHTINPKYLGYFAVMEKHDLASVIDRIEYALLEDRPLVVIGFHGVIKEDEKMVEGSYYCSAELFKGVCQFLKDNNLPVYSFEKALEILNSN